MDLISLRCRGEALTRYWSRFMSNHSNTITRWWNKLNVPKYLTILRWSNLRFISTSMQRVWTQTTGPTLFGGRHEIPGILLQLFSLSSEKLNSKPRRGCRCCFWGSLQPKVRCWPVSCTSALFQTSPPQWRAQGWTLSRTGCSDQKPFSEEVKGNGSKQVKGEAAKAQLVPISPSLPLRTWSHLLFPV